MQYFCKLCIIKKYCWKFCKTYSMSTVSYKRTRYKLDENLQTKFHYWTKKNMKTSCLNWRDVEWYWCLNGNKPQKMFSSVKSSKRSVISISPCGNTTSKITGKQTNSHTAKFFLQTRQQGIGIAGNFEHW